MGLFISTINEEGCVKSNPNRCWSETLQKIKQYHGMFKYVCDCFVINTEQFKQIFGTLEKAKTWDPKSQGKVDALQIFCGLILFAQQASFKSKLSFLFSIFDFNQIKSLSFIDVEVIVLNVCNSVYKILNKNGKVNENQIADWLGNYFQKRQRIKITRLYKFCLQNQDIQSFFKCIKANIDDSLQFPLSSAGNLSDTDRTSQEKIRKQAKNKINMWEFSSKYKEQIASNQEWHKDLINKIVKVQDLQYKNQEQAKGQQSSYGCKVTWVYGINLEGQSKPFIPLRKLGNCIAYRASSMAIVHDLQLSYQHIIQGHEQQLSCIAYNQKQQILATVQNHKFPNINLWKRQGSGIKAQKNQKFKKYAVIPTNHSKGIQLMEFVARQTLLATVGAREKNTPILIYNFSRLEVTHHIIMEENITMLFNPLLLLDRTEVSNHIFETFFVCCENNTIYEICLKINETAGNYEKKQHSYIELQKANNILTAIGCFLNINNPYLRSYKDKSISMSIITGHQSGSVCKITPYPKFNEQEIISSLDGPVVCLQITNTILAVGAGSYVYIYDLDILNNKGGVLMSVNLKGQNHIDFLSYGIKYFDFIKDYILGVTESGEFIKIETKVQLNRKKQEQKGKIPLKETLNQKNSESQELRLSLVTRIIKFDGPNNIFCILDWKVGHQMILFATKGNKVLGIDSQTHQIQDVWEISTIQIIVALDAVCSDQGVCYIICACKSGRLYIRVDWEQSPKYYDCGSQIVDAKISRDCSYLLVATRSNYLLFFAQVNNNFTSPRKLLFQYETPCSINFLDNFKFFLVITSAKNSYIIEIPQLKHKKLNKQTQKISISKVNIKYPYSNGCLGGSMRFSLLSLKERDIYFFNSHNALERGNYTVLKTHKCPVSQIAVNQLQSKFYSLGKCDNTLIEWSVFESKYKTKKGAGYFDKEIQMLGIKQSISLFEDILQFAACRNLSNQSQHQEFKSRNRSETYFFKGTKLQKLNQLIQKYYRLYLKQIAWKKCKLNAINRDYQQTDEIDFMVQNFDKVQEENQQEFQKRAPGISLIAEEVYGFQTLHKHSLTYANNGEQIMGHSSRFIIRMNIKSKKQIIYEPTRKKISFLTRSQFDNEILYCLVEQNPMIYMLCRQPLRTTHHKGIIHLSLYKNYVLSYGIAEKSGYSINLHNYLTGQLLHTSFTDIRVCQFILVNQKLAVSFNQVRVWESFYPSEFIITASAGCLLPNKKDILLGLYDGRFAILSDRGIFHLHSQIQQKAHDNIIDIIRIKYQKKNQENYEIISVGRDQKIKIWTNCFEIKMMISLRQKNNLSFLGENNKPVLSAQVVRVKSMDIYENKILLAMHTGNIIEVELEKAKKIQNKGNDQTNRQQNQTSINIPLVSDKSFSYASISNHDDDSVISEVKLKEMTYKWTNLYQTHSVRNKKSSNRRTFFSVHPVHPLLASSACDYQLIIRNYETNQIVCKVFYEKQKVESIKFSPKGNLLAVGYDNGHIQFYKVKIIKDQAQKIQNVMLESSQIFRQAQHKSLFLKTTNNPNVNRSMSMSMSMSHNGNIISNICDHEANKPIFSIINMEFSQCSTYFAVSCVVQMQKKTQSFIILYRQSSSLTVGNHHNPMNISKLNRNVNDTEAPCYTQADLIQIASSSEQSLTTNNSKYTKSAYFIQFLIETAESKNFGQNQSSSGKTLSKSITNLSQNKKEDLKIKNQKNQVYLVLFEQYLDANKVRINSDNKVKIKTYQIEQKAIFRQDCNINFLKIKFPHFVYARLFNNNDHYFNIKTGFTPSLSNNNSVDDYYNSHAKYENTSKFDQKQDIEITISQMLTLGENVFYGDSTGKLHIVKLNSLLMNNELNKQSQQSNKSKNQGLNQNNSGNSANIQNSQNNQKHYSLYKPQRSNMNLSKTYCSHTSFINQIQVSKDQKYLFVSGGIDDAIVKYRLVNQKKCMDLDNKPYAITQKDLHDQYAPDDKFYDFLNNIDPIRDEISEIMLDVEEEPNEERKLTNSNKKGTKLQLVRIYGRRAFDKRNNLFQDKQGNLIYYLGPNIIIQNPFQPQKQKHIGVDPNPYTKSPQISYMTMNDKYLIAATQQENSRIFVWDIYSITCLSEMKLKNFSVVYHMVQSSTQKVILVYGINNLMEPSMQLIDWNERQVIGNVNMMYSGRWKIKDICQISQKQDGLQFVSCGVYHLAYWEYIADTLVYSSFGLDNPALSEQTFLTVKFVDDLIVTASQEGFIYVLKGFQLVASLQVHQGAIRTLSIDNQLIFSGGIDGKVKVTSINIDQIQKYYLRILEEHSIKIKSEKQKKRHSQISCPSSRNNKRSIIASEPLQNQNEQENKQAKQTKQVILTQQDIQSIVLVKNDQNHKKGIINKIFVGTRSGNILLLKRQMNDYKTKSNINTLNNISVNESNKSISRKNSTIYSGEKFAVTSGQVQPIIWAHDNDSIVSVCFDEQKPDLFYLVTFSGILEIWSLKTFKRLYFYKISGEAKKVFSFKQYIIVCCQKCILTVKVDIASNSIHYIKQMSKVYDGNITECCLSKSCSINNSEGVANKDDSSQKESNASKTSVVEGSNKGAYLVIGLKKNDLNQIIINEIENEIKQKNIVVNLKYEIQFMDFSRNCKYLLFKDSFQELGMVNLQDNRRINTIFVQMGIEWESEGIRISPHGQRIYCSYSRENKITVLRRINEREIIIGDEMGTLRTFQYPCPEQKLGQLHTQCYATHMNFIKSIEIHPTEPYAISTSVYDRSLILWKLKSE